MLVCFNKFTLFGKLRLDYLTRQMVAYLKHHRKHSERDHLPIIRELPAESFTKKAAQSYEDTEGS
ncbi:hypothetical protein [Rubinisphaera sp. JC750]|uniref:hypothetical protein n=1 Tax=Rubinisphaera sp. JC750 TaxID=2898658 RepID=UPI001F39AEC4|nr:hypothetical protein [Rubinisphaera sp. JC750]